ncbi:Rho GTPase activation protein [Neocallimastix californiae]|uniref:Rho GTPase activation protein n=1 Tax=Neocallimastix californiae TaxID=1754190 RepID=A0A1Y2ELX7_9FUNG|nr:Rho GTPase activation protein [Neocallimastix californiae]|eukprot:ORY72519.1 Rho GTPase activation protein [Neocallimastix californiae]
MPLCCCCCCGDKNLIFGRSIEDMLDNGMTVPVEIQKFVNYLSERNAIQYKEFFLKSSDPKENNKLIKKINKAGKIDLKDAHDIHVVVSVFIEFLRRMPGRVISKEQFGNFQYISGKGKRRDIKKVQKGLETLPKSRYETLRYLMRFFTGNTGSININLSDILIIVPIIASALIETSNDYTLMSKIYKNGNVINYAPSTDNLNAIESGRKRENVIRLLISNYSKFFDNEEQEESREEFEYDPDDEYETPNYKSYPEYDTSALPRVHVRVSSKQVRSRSPSPSPSPISTLNEKYDLYSSDDNRSKYVSSGTLDKNDFSIKNVKYNIIDGKIHLSFTITAPESLSQDINLDIPQSGTGMASIRNASLDNDSSTQLFRVTSFTEGPKLNKVSEYQSDSDSTIDNPKNLDIKLNLPVLQDKKYKNSNSYPNSFQNSNSFININYPNDNKGLGTQSIVVQPDESVITELQLFLKATRRYLYDLQSFPTGHIRELFKFSKERYKLIKEVLADDPYINLEPIVSSQLFGPNKCFVPYEGLDNLSPAQQTLMEYDLFKKSNNIEEFVFQKSVEHCQMEKEFLYQRLIALKDNIITENDRHILHELNKIYNSIRENIKKNQN